MRDAAKRRSRLRAKRAGLTTGLVSRGGVNRAHCDTEVATDRIALSRESRKANEDALARQEKEAAMGCCGRRGETAGCGARAVNSA